MLIYRSAIYRKALTPEQKEMKKDWLVQQAKEQECVPPSFEKIVEKYERVKMALWEEETMELEGMDVDNLIRRDYDDYDIEQQALERVQDDLDALDEQYEEVREQISYELDDDKLQALYDKEWEIESAKDVLREEAVKDIWNDLREEYEKKVDEEVEEKVRERYEDFLYEAEDQLAYMDEGDVWRVVVMEEAVDPARLTGIGRFWTRVEEYARPFMNFFEYEKMKSPKVVRFHARPDVESIDICGTLEANVFGKVTGNRTDETEVRFYKHAPIYVYKAEVIDMDPIHADIDEEAKVLETIPIEAMRRC